MDTRWARWFILFGVLAMASLPGSRVEATSTFQFGFDHPNATYWVNPGGSVSVQVFLVETYTGSSVLQSESGLLSAGVTLSYGNSSPTHTVTLANNAGNTGAATDAAHFNDSQNGFPYDPVGNPGSPSTATFFDAATIAAADPSHNNPLGGIAEFRTISDALGNYNPIGAGGLGTDATRFGANTYAILLGTFTFNGVAGTYTAPQQNVIDLSTLLTSSGDYNYTYTSFSSLDASPGVDPNQFVINVVPEPPSAVMLGGLLLMGSTLAGVYRWRKRAPKAGAQPAAPAATAESEDDETNLAL